jgi:hypothetical protein
MPKPTRPATTRIEIHTAMKPSSPSALRTAGKKRLTSTTKPASWATTHITPIACLRRVILTANPHVPCQKQREPAKNGVSRRTVTRLPFPVSLKTLTKLLARTVFGNEAGVVRFFMAAAWFAGGGAIIKFHPSRRHHSRNWGKVEGMPQSVWELVCFVVRSGAKSTAAFRRRRNHWRSGVRF